MSLSKLWVCEQSAFKNMEFIMEDYFRLIPRFPRLLFRELTGNELKNGLADQKLMMPV